MRILICDDDLFIVDLLKDIVTEYFASHSIPVQITTKTSANEVISENNVYDIAFLDVEMGSHNGLDVAEHLKKINSSVILFIITAFPEYLDRAMDLRVFRYLPKPLDKERIFSGLDSAMKYYSENTKVLFVNGIDSGRVYVKDILFVSIYKRKTMIVTKNEEIISNQTLGHWKEVLGSVSFAQPHYSYLVNLENIEKIKNGIIVFEKNNKEKIYVKISQRLNKEFKNKFFDYYAN